MANTTNFGWETPDDTDLVKDGAAAIRTLAGAIDTSLVDLKGGTTDQVLAKNSGTDMDFKWVADASGIPATIFDAKGDLIVASAADTAARLAVGTNGHILVADSAEATGLKWQAPASGSRSYAVFQDVKALGTAGGTFTSGAWRTRDLQTTQINNISGASLSSNQITLPAGTYFVSASAPAYSLYRHYTKLFNTSDSSDTLAGTIEFTSANQQIVTRSFIVGQFTIAASKTFEVQHYASNTKATDGFGTSEDNQLGTQTNVYTTIAIEKIG